MSSHPASYLAAPFTATYSIPLALMTSAKLHRYSLYRGGLCNLQTFTEVLLSFLWWLYHARSRYREG